MATFVLFEEKMFALTMRINTSRLAPKYTQGESQQNELAHRNESTADWRVGVRSQSVLQAELRAVAKKAMPYPADLCGFHPPEVRKDVCLTLFGKNNMGVWVGLLLYKVRGCPPGPVSIPWQQAEVNASCMVWEQAGMQCAPRPCNLQLRFPEPGLFTSRSWDFLL